MGDGPQINTNKCMHVFELTSPVGLGPACCEHLVKSGLLRSVGQVRWYWMDLALVVTMVPVPVPCAFLFSSPRTEWEDGREGDRFVPLLSVVCCRFSRHL